MKTPDEQINDLDKKPKTQNYRLVYALASFILTWIFIVIGLSVLAAIFTLLFLLWVWMIGVWL